MKKHKKTILIIMIIIILFFSGYSLGKSYQNIKLQANGKIAEPILVVENNPTIEMNGENEKEYYDFKVKNSTKDGKINETDLEYYIEILTKTDESISFELYRNGEKITLKNNKTENIKMQKEKNQEDKYRLEIKYDKTKNSSFEDIMQDIQIKVHSEQLKG